MEEDRKKWQAAEAFLVPLKEKLISLEAQIESDQLTLQETVQRYRGALEAIMKLQHDLTFHPAKAYKEAATLAADALGVSL